MPTSVPKGAISRPMITKILHFWDKENILKGARNGLELEFNGYRISIYPDFSADTFRVLPKNAVALSRRWRE